MGYYTEIELDKPRRLRYDFNSIADIEERAGMGIGAMFSEQRVGFHTIRLLIWGGLKHADHGLTIQRVGGMIQKCLDNGGSLADLTTAAKAALYNSGVFGKVEESEEEDTEGNVTAEAAK